MTRRPVQQMHVERRQLSGAREWIDDAPRVSGAVVAELRAWAGAEDAVESERKSVRSENLDSALLALRASKKYHTAARSRTPEASGAAHQTGSTWRRAMQRGAERVSQRYNAQVQRHVGERGTRAGDMSAR